MRVLLGWSSNFATSRVSCPSRTSTSAPWPPYHRSEEAPEVVGWPRPPARLQSGHPNSRGEGSDSHIGRVKLAWSCKGWSDWSVAAQCEAHGMAWQAWQRLLRVVLVSALEAPPPQPPGKLAALLPRVLDVSSAPHLHDDKREGWLPIQCHLNVSFGDR